MSRGPQARHTACRRGTPVLVKFKNGKNIVDIFVDRTSGGTITLEKYGKIKKDEIRSFQVDPKKRR